MKKYKEIAIYSLFDNFQIVQAEFATGFHVIIGASVTKAIVESSLHQLSALLTLVSPENISQIYAMLQSAKLYAMYLCTLLLIKPSGSHSRQSVLSRCVVTFLL